jgi:predicted NAD/FAD-binding protein
LIEIRYNPISPESFEEQVYSQFYNDNAAATAAIDDRLLSHRQALLFIVFAIGTLTNTSEPAYSLEAEKYHQLARASLFSHPLFEDLTVDAIQALLRLSYRFKCFCYLSFHGSF